MMAFERFVMGLRQEIVVVAVLWDYVDFRSGAVLGELVIEGPVIGAEAEAEGVESAVPLLYLAMSMIATLVSGRLVHLYLLLDQSSTVRFLEVVSSLFLRRA